MSEGQFDFAVVGAGIVGLAHAYHLGKAGKRVAVFERNARAVGASIRNFGMIWPIGQPAGEMREMAVRSRGYWLEVLEASGIWHRACGSLHLAYHDDEMEVLEEFAALAPSNGYDCITISPAETLLKCGELRAQGLRGALWSPEELCVFPRQVVAELPAFLEERFGVSFFFGSPVTEIETGHLVAGGDDFYAEQIVVCPGDDLTGLFRAELAEAGMELIKLQMLRARPRREPYDLQCHLCAGLTLGHYANFRICQKLPALLERYRRDWPEQVAAGVHLLVSRHGDGWLTIGDSHETVAAANPFLSEQFERLILAYLDTFLPVEALEVLERWHGVYAKNPSRGYIVLDPLPGVKIATGVAGAGMTLSFGFAAKVVGSLL